jgi:crossover junction endodeoxyribonuclease RuvC
MTYILGIDPGMGGALAIYHSTETPKLWDMPKAIDGGIDPKELASLVEIIAFSAPSITAVVERVSSMPRQAGAFAFGLSTGIIHGCLASRGIPFELVSPSVWKAKMGLTKFPDETYAQNKTRARALATQLFPALASQFNRVKDDGRAEALLLAVYYANRK